MQKKLCILILLLLMVTTTFAAVAATTKRPAPPKKVTVKTNAGTAAAKNQPRKPNQAKPLPRLLDLGANKCIPCKMMFPVLDQLKKDYEGKLTVEFIDVWKNPSAGEKYKVKMIPTQIFYDRKGKEVFRHQGYFPKEDIIAAFKKHGIKL